MKNKLSSLEFWFLKILINKMTLKSFFRKQIWDRLSDERYIKIIYLRATREKLDLLNPVTFNEKIQWLKLYWHDDLARLCADKFEVRQFVERRVGRHILNNLIGVYDRVEDIDFNKLPSKFVLKATHGSGYNLICNDKEKLRWDHELSKMKKWINTDYYLSGREWVYKGLTPRILCEQYLEGEDNQPPSDYKILCFNGVPELIWVDIDRFGNHRRQFYDQEWNLQKVSIAYPNNGDVIIEKPNKLDEMLNIAKKLSASFPHVRVDLYYVGNKIYFGEMTFFSGNGLEEFNPKVFGERLGSLISLPK